MCCTRSCGCDMFPYKIIKSFICVDKRNALGAKVCCTSSHGCVKLSCALVWSLNHLAVFLKIMLWGLRCIARWYSDWITWLCLVSLCLGMITESFWLQFGMVTLSLGCALQLGMVTVTLLCCFFPWHGNETTRLYSVALCLGMVTVTLLCLVFMCTALIWSWVVDWAQNTT